ncbi:T9SS type A sorting domain-containing protein [Flavobacterium sp. 25HG05S-40]|uniref:T9SS type A sorting domain-containing protein n=1 Tax=Flavobacterium sp. 25HG05S-40 TaxID=3458682 RepID=UPI004044A6C3
MRKNYFLSFFKSKINATNEAQVLKKSTLAFAVLLCSMVTSLSAQTTVIDPAGAGGFELGTTLAANGWTGTTTGINRTQWSVGTNAAGFTGNRCGFVGQNASNGVYTYTLTAVRATHLIRPVTFTTGETTINLSFRWQGVGEVGLDRMRVWLFDPAIVADPVYGTAITAGVGKTQIGLAEYSNQATWTTASIVIPASFAGTNAKLIFEWSNNISAGTQPPAAVDDISLTSTAPYPDDCSTARILAIGGITCTPQIFNNTTATNSNLSMSPVPPAPTCGNYGATNRDMWFRAAFGIDGTLRVELSSVGGGLTNPAMSAYTGTCAGLTQIACAADNGLNPFPVLALTGTPSAIVYIRVWSENTGAPVYGSFGICATSPTCFRPTVGGTTSITASSATINWNWNTQIPSGGYQYVVSTSAATPTSGWTSVPNTTTSANITGLSPFTIYYVFVRGFCGGTDYSNWGFNSFTTIIPPPTTTNVNMCSGQTGSMTATGVCSGFTNIGTTISGTLSLSDPTAFRPVTVITSGDACNFDTFATRNYTSYTFEVNATGTYVFTMDNNTGFDAMAYITSGPFIPGDCLAGGVYYGGDDDSAGAFEPRVTTTLTVGVQYTLYTTSWGLGGNGPFSYTITGPGSLVTPASGTIQWYTVPSGGTPIASGSSFNPVGVLGSGVANNTTPIGPITYYAACSTFPNIRGAATFTINPSPSSVISGTGSACATTTVSIALTGTSPWTFTYTDGVTPVTITNTSTTPYTFSASPGVATTYTVSALSNATCATTSASNRTGSAVLYSKVWNGGTANWNTASNWTPSGVPSSTDCVVIANAGTPPVISGTNFYAFADRVTVNNSAVLRVNATNSLTVTNGVNVATTIPIGNIILDDDASLVQVTDVMANNNTGRITFNRTTNIVRADYVYWSSPFAALNAALISPATNPFYIYKWNPSLANPNLGQGFWVAGNDNPMTVGKGYIIRAPDLHPFVNTPYTATVSGVPNNGVINTPISRGSILVSFPGANSVMIDALDDNYNLVGNPYPSSIDAVKFLTDNNTNLADLSVRLWTHNTPIGGSSSTFYNSYVYGYADSYITFNISGPNPPGFGGKIASGQGFFVLANETSPTLQFNNTMRRFDHDNTEFFRGPGNAVNNYNALERHRVWLSILNETNANATTMICYVDGATLAKDRMFDSSTNDNSGALSIYSLIDEEKMLIQGRPNPFNVNDIVPLGYTANQNGIYKIAIANVDGLFTSSSQGIYLEDTELGIMHDLRSNYYTFSTNSGTVTTRFKLHYTNSALGTSDGDALNTLSYINNNVLNIQSIKNIETVDIFDVTGKLIKSCTSTEAKQTFETDFNYPQGVYVLKIKLDTGFYVTKKQMN